MAHNAADFGNYGPTPFGGGYDIALTYGRPLRPSDAICYPNSSSSPSNITFDRHHYSPNCKPCAYVDEALRIEYSSYGRPKPVPKPIPGPVPACDFQPRRPHGEYRPHQQQDDGFRTGMNRQGYGSDELGSGYVFRKPGYGEEPPRRRSGEEIGGGFGYGSEHKRTEEYGFGGRRTEMPSYGGPGYKHREEEEVRRLAYGTPSYEMQKKEEEHRRTIDGEEAWKYQELSYDGESHGRPKQGDSSDDDDDKEKKHRRHKQHHHQRHHHH